MTELTDSELEQLRQQMVQLKLQLRQVLEGQHQKAEPVVLDQQSVGRVSRIDAIQQQQMAKAGEQQTSQRLMAISKALRHFDEGDYGYCEQCGLPINVARLKIKPEAQYCIQCQSEHD
ncbi:MAG: TraR/DksA C4-type zinc finger protein [Psychrosphaera sp.]|nr:TraR/DksA C4-type zinc finger protein [Psychrosphaera sp.]